MKGVAACGRAVTSKLNYWRHLHVAGPYIGRSVPAGPHLKAADPLDRYAVNLPLTGKALALFGAVAPDLDKVNAPPFESVTTRDFRI